MNSFGAKPASAFGTAGATGGFGTSTGGFGGFGSAGGGGSGTLGNFSAGSSNFGALGTGIGMAANENVAVNGDTPFTELPPSVQQKIWQVYSSMIEHRKNAQLIRDFSTQPNNLEAHTEKLKLDIMRVQNAHSEISNFAADLRNDVDRLRTYVQKVKRGDMQTPYQVSLRSSQEQWQLQQDAHTRILQEMVEGFEGRLGEYDMHIQELYRKLVPGRGGSSVGLNESDSVTPRELASLIRMQNEAFLKVAGQVAVVHELVESLRSEWDSRTGQDPFEELDRLSAEEEDRKRKAANLATGGTDPMTGATMFQLGHTSSLTTPQTAPVSGLGFGSPQPGAGGMGVGLFGGGGQTSTALGQGPAAQTGTSMFGGFQQQTPPSLNFGLGDTSGGGTGPRTTRATQGKATKARR